LPGIAGGCYIKLELPDVLENRSNARIAPIGDAVLGTGKVPSYPIVAGVR
jgi:hypothetical protein